MEDFSNLWVTTRLFLFNDWKDIVKTLEDYFHTKIIINPLSTDKALIRSSLCNFEELAENPVSGRGLGHFTSS